jgi:hypothetical protein
MFLVSIENKYRKGKLKDRTRGSKKRLKIQCLLTVEAGVVKNFFTMGATTYLLHNGSVSFFSMQA